jgi:hypothetical protein
MRRDSRGVQDASGVAIGRRVGVGVGGGGGGGGIVAMRYPRAMLTTTRMLRTKKTI